jgi:hypothetical protein
MGLLLHLSMPTKLHDRLLNIRMRELALLFLARLRLASVGPARVTAMRSGRGFTDPHILICA